MDYRLEVFYRGGGKASILYGGYDQQFVVNRSASIFADYDVVKTTVYKCLPNGQECSIISTEIRYGFYSAKYAAQYRSIIYLRPNGEEVEVTMVNSNPEYKNKWDDMICVGEVLRLKDDKSFTLPVKQKPELMVSVGLVLRQKVTKLTQGIKNEMD
jgi:hypothetical protein